jgi:hypothetical protein
MDAPVLYEIRIAGSLSARWMDWLDGLAILPAPGGATLLRGHLSDQAALLGVLMKLQALNITLLEVKRLAGE